MRPAIGLEGKGCGISHVCPTHRCELCEVSVGMEVAVKQEASCKATPTDHALMAESVDFVNLEERILQLCSESPKGITDGVIAQDQPLVDTERRVAALQRLLSQVYTLYTHTLCMCAQLYVHDACRCTYVHMQRRATCTCACMAHVNVVQK